MSFSLTVTKIDFQTMPSVTRDFSGHEINNLRPSTEGNTSSAAIFEDANGRTIYVTQTYSAVQTSKTNDMVEAGAELQSNKDATGGYAGLTLFKINFKNALNTFTSFFTNANTAARTYTFQDRDGTISDLSDLKRYGTAAGTDTYTLSLSTLTFAGAPADAGIHIIVKFTNANTGAATLNINGGGAKAIVKRDGTTALSAADIAATSTYQLCYNGTAWVLM